MMLCFVIPHFGRYFSIVLALWTDIFQSFLHYKIDNKIANPYALLECLFFKIVVCLVRLWGKIATRRSWDTVFVNEANVNNAERINTSHMSHAYFGMFSRERHSSTITTKWYNALVIFIQLVLAGKIAKPNLCWNRKSGWVLHFHEFVYSWI
jgi:hypothetical protein